MQTNRARNRLWSMRVSWLDLVGLDLVGFPLNHRGVQGPERARRETDYILHTLAARAGRWSQRVVGRDCFAQVCKSALLRQMAEVLLVALGVPVHHSPSVYLSLGSKWRKATPVHHSSSVYLSLASKWRRATPVRHSPSVYLSLAP